MSLLGEERCCCFLNKVLTQSLNKVYIAGFTGGGGEWPKGSASVMTSLRGITFGQSFGHFLLLLGMPAVMFISVL